LGFLNTATGSEALVHNTVATATGLAGPVGQHGSNQKVLSAKPLHHHSISGGFEQSVPGDLDVGAMPSSTRNWLKANQPGTTSLPRTVEPLRLVVSKSPDRGLQARHEFVGPR
jgi:hypothetical protein